MDKLRINRDTFYDPSNKRLDVLDNRYYFITDENEGVYYPSVTTVLDAFPKGHQFAVWQKSVGFNADRIVAEAANTGTNVHKAIEKYLKGDRVIFGQLVDGVFIANYTLQEWEMILKFVDFWTASNPRLITSEVTIVSHNHKIGGTIDIVCEINGEVWLIDAKSSNNVYDTHELQIAAYATLWNEVNPDYFIQRAGILWLKALTRSADKAGKKIQGAGWQLKEFDRHYGDAFKVFRSLRKVWDDINPTYKPEIYSMPTEVQLAIATNEAPDNNMAEASPRRRVKE